jgi:3-oxoacyl-[acyl-carrier-protein] synthase II
MPTVVDELELFHPKRALRRTSHYCRLALLGANLALKDAGMAISDISEGRLGVIVATGYGPARTTFDFLDSIHDFGARLASPTAFSTSVHNIAASTISLLLGIKGPCLSINQFAASLGSALISAQCWISDGRVDAVLVGAVDEYDTTLQEGITTSSMADSASANSAEGAVFLLLKNGTGGKHGMLESVTMIRRDAGTPKGPEGTADLPAGPALALARAICGRKAVSVSGHDASGLLTTIGVGGF